jgi:hypothetical protein
MRDFAEILKEHDIEKPKKYWSGKGAGKDDLIITVLLCVYWSRFFYKRYVNHVKR